MSAPILIQAGWFIDGGGGPVRENITLSLGPEGIRRIFADPTPDPIPGPDTADLPGVRIVDWRSCTVLPGLIDAHVHLCWSGTLDPDTRRSQLSFSYPEVQSVIGRHLAAHLRHGVTAVRDGGDPFGHGPAFKAQYTADSEPYPDIKAAGPAFHRKGRYGRIIGRAVDSGSDLAAALDHPACPRDQLKLVNSGLNSLTEFGRTTAPQFSTAALTQVVALAHRRNLPVMVHANGPIPVGRAIDAGVDSIEHGFFMGRDNLAAMADQRIVWVPTCVTMAAFAAHRPGVEGEVARKTLDHQLAQLDQARVLGVPVALGTDAGGLGVDHGRAVAWELELLMEAGYSLSEAVCCATHHGARLLETRHPGCITIGANPDLIAVSGPPQTLPASLTHIEGMVLDGELRCPTTE